MLKLFHRNEVLLVQQDALPHFTLIKTFKKLSNSYMICLNFIIMVLLQKIYLLLFMFQFTPLMQCTWFLYSCILSKPKLVPYPSRCRGLMQSNMHSHEMIQQGGQFLSNLKWTPVCYCKHNSSHSQLRQLRGVTGANPGLYGCKACALPLSYATIYSLHFP